MVMPCATTSRNLGIVIAAACVIVGGTESTAGYDRPVVMVQILDPLLVRDLDDALRQTARIFEAAGVALVPWTKGNEPTRGRVVRVSLVEGHRANRLIGDRKVLGMAVRRANLAYVHVERVATYASKHRMALPRVLGNAIAHEVGHILLPIPGHSSAGIMAEILPIVPEVPSFSREQAAAISAALPGPQPFVNGMMSLLVDPR